MVYQDGSVASDLALCILLVLVTPPVIRDGSER